MGCGCNQGIEDSHETSSSGLKKLKSKKHTRSATSSPPDEKSSIKSNDRCTLKRSKTVKEKTHVGIAPIPTLNKVVKKSQFKKQAERQNSLGIKKQCINKL